MALSVSMPPAPLVLSVGFPQAEQNGGERRGAVLRDQDACPASGSASCSRANVGGKTLIQRS